MVTLLAMSQCHYNNRTKCVFDTMNDLVSEAIRE